MYESELLTAVSHGNRDAALRLLMAGADPNKKVSGIYPLAEAVDRGEANVAEVLLEYGADPNRPISMNYSYAQSTVRWSDDETLKVLVKHGADIFKETAPGRTLLDEAYEGRRPRCVYVLTAAGLTPDRYMTRYGTDPEVRAWFDVTAPAVGAFLKKEYDLFRSLVGKGADPNTMIGPHTLLTEAARIGDLEAVRILIENRADLSRPMTLGATPLMVAACYGRFEIVKALLDAGARADETDQKGTTAREHALFHGFTKVAELLEEHGG